MAIGTPGSNVSSPRGTRLGSSIWGGPFIVGLLISLLGCFALISVGIASLATTFFYGALLVCMGIGEIVHAFGVRKTGPFLLYLLGGVLSIVVGVLVLTRPDAGLAALTLMLAGYFFATGLFRTIASLMDRYPRWGWDCVDGIVSMVLGSFITAQWPNSTIWAVGTVVGVSLLSRGLALMADSLAARSVMREATSP
ncbi:HdeD family acid-resistance protein [Vitiosangium sp. GDMCC 1.1324]|uniref:HdeD family acid-resistance protein n=1 Tax=Vitiosangium sp. (strain GDMCC 1.1324) TaxID=2138576 RepID=UPI000D3D7E22|nr:HdeD family acid-resistance protein [Vitiosangium sp. GDMCC 1.1324]PTL78833.1 hypothetical protein DAT35_37895 [Vitiosangium sp. GDMCC 1.1324]